MARLCLALLLVIGAALAKPSLKKLTTPKQEKSLTVDDIKNGCDRMFNNSEASVIKTYMVSYVYDNIKGFCDSDAEITCFVGLINEFKGAKNLNQTYVQDKVQSTCPDIYARIKSINASYEADFDRLNPEAQAYLNDFNAEFKNMDPTASRDVQATSYVCILIKYFNRLDKNPSIVASFKDVWPGPMSGYDEIKKCRYYNMFKMMTSKMTDKSCPSFIGGMMKLAAKGKTADTSSFAMMG